MKFLAHGIECDFHVFDDGITFILCIECFFAGTFDGVLQKIEQTSDARRLSLFDKLLASGTDEKCLHVASSLGQIKQLPPVRSRPHLDNASRLIESHVGKRSRWYVHVRSTPAVRELDNAGRKIAD